MNLYLMRHGESECNHATNNAPSVPLDCDLTDLGRSQARNAVDALKALNLTHVYISPLLRTLRTIAPFCTETGMTAKLLPDMAEYLAAYAPRNGFQGMSLGEIKTKFWFVEHDELAYPWWPSPTETRTEAYARVLRARAYLESQHIQNDRVLVVSHSEPISHMLGSYQRAYDPNHPMSFSNCSITGVIK